jgi:hypothetical protein
VAGAVLLALAMVIATVAHRPPGREPAMRTMPALAIADNVSALAAGYGSIWAADEDAGRIVRVDPGRS